MGVKLSVNDVIIIVYNIIIVLKYSILLLIDRAIRRNWVMLDSLVEKYRMTQ